MYVELYVLQVRSSFEKEQHRHTSAVLSVDGHYCLLLLLCVQLRTTRWKL